MTDQSHREAMNAAIRAQRERHAVPKTIAPEPAGAAPAPPAAPEQPKSRLQRLRRK
jgi:hypothetical protein